MHEYFFSIIIPTYNRAALIVDTLKSIYKSDYKNFEIIVVDDGSKDDTEMVLQEFRKLDNFQYYKKENGERGAARNFGARLAKGDYLNFFDSDDLMYPNHLSVASEFINQNTNPEWFHLGYDYKDKHGKLLNICKYDGNSKAKLYFDNILSCGGGFVRSDIAKAYPFNEDRTLASSEDWELWIRLNSNFPLVFSNEITSTVVAHDLRSLFVIKSEELIPRDLHLITCIEENKMVHSEYENKFNKFKADRFTFFMLQLAEEGKKKEVVSWAIKSLKTYPLVIFSKRFLASLKNIVLK